ncbi:MAG TPA: DUF4038 domain-containing protein [Spirochaetia bacterium]|nr:DUF4038 domain-containing protein [Spirochaetia bacterium]
MRTPVSASGHFFRNSDGSPFFYLADTVWMLFNKLTEREARSLFEDRAAKGFTVIQSVIFRDLFEPNTPNAHGVKPFASDADMREVRMNPEWIAYVVTLTNIAAEYDLIMGLLPTWGDKWNEHSNSAGPVIMDRASAREYCRYLSDSLGECENVIWILGGDSPVQKQEYADTIRAMADGIRSGASADRLMTFHPSGMGSSDLFHAEPWLDFNSLQTSHYKPNIPGYLSIERLVNQLPVKPCLDMEPNYELSPMFVMLGASREGSFTPRFSAYDVRKSYYRTVLAGAAGFTYGCEPIRQLHRAGDPIHIFEGSEMITWEKALTAPGSAQLNLLPQILRERSYFTRVPAGELFLPLQQAGAWPDRMSVGIASAGQQNTDPAAHISVARCTEGSYVMAYVPVRQLLTLDTSGLEGSEIRVSFYDPQGCEKTHTWTEPNAGRVRLVPERDLDTFVVIDSVR